jgi:metal-responsive CopG/Arc/MetJ family transcriptional regulator
MKKQIRISLRIDEETNQMLDVISKKNIRNTSDMVRILIRQEFGRGSYDLQQGENGNGHANDFAQE